MSTPDRKPRIALMGEFSAGKSTLSNLLLGARPLPEKVTATRLSPVWMSQGTAAPYRVDVQGQESPVSLDRLQEISVDDTRVIRLFFEADVLSLCDLIDFPGISDPNMSSDVWLRMLNEVDAILWCTHATQAWRQSESAVWETIPDAVKAHSALLITRFDKLTNERDAQRVMARVGQETTGQFAGLFPISLTDALEAGDDFDAFEASGGIDFLEYFLAMVENVAGQIGADGAPLCAERTFDETTSSAAETQPQVAVDVAALADTASQEVAQTEALSLASADPAPGVAAASAPEPLHEETLVMAKPEPAEEPRTGMPRRVRPEGRKARRPRPAGTTKNFDLAGSEESTQATGSQQTSAQLRAVFQEAPDVNER